MEQKEVEGVCGNCTCYIGHTLDNDDEICLNCGCKDFIPDDLTDLLKKVAVSSQDGFHKTPIYKYEFFLGKVSRECKGCGSVLLYKEFQDSRDPTMLCTYCIAGIEADGAEEEVDYYLELETIEQDALERQEMIDECLRGLDE